jgi:hypothetical protein
MPTLPVLDKNVNLSPHVVILGAGASLAAFPDGDANGLRLPLMRDLVRTAGLEESLQRAGIADTEVSFEDLYDELVSSNANPQLVADIEAKVFACFSKMRLPDRPTIYDYLLLSLREKDVIATFNWDPFLIQAFKRNLSVRRLPEVVFLHGNVGVGLCLEDKACGYIDLLCSSCHRPFTPTKLLYPVKHKDYNADVYIKDQWDRLRWHLNRAYFLTVFGYSAPKTDVEAKALMLEVWKENWSLELAEMEIIDIKGREELEETWDEFTYSHHYSVSKTILDSDLFRFPRRSCDAFAEAPLMLRPWKEDPFPEFDNLWDLQKWIQPLLDEEHLYEEAKAEFSGVPCSEMKKKALTTA